MVVAPLVDGVVLLHSAGDGCLAAASINGILVILILMYGSDLQVNMLGCPDIIEEGVCLGKEFLHQFSISVGEPGSEASKAIALLLH